MTMRSKSPSYTHSNIQAVLYARVSTKDQEKEGYSIPAQQRLLREYALARSMVIVEEFVDVETGKQAGRTEFTRMLTYLKGRAGTCRTILVEKTDRLYRNLKDWTTLDDLGVTIHLVKEGRIIGPESHSSDQLVHGINVLMARNYVLNLGEETRKGMLEKARSGIYPSYARVGYPLAIHSLDDHGRLVRLILTFRVARTSDGAGRTEKYLARDAIRALRIPASECYAER